MIDFEALRRMGTTNERLKQVFTRKAIGQGEEPELRKRLGDDGFEEFKAKVDADIKVAEKMQEWASTTIQESIDLGLKTYSIYGAVDIAWDSTPINKATIPLMMFAQGKIDAAQCANCITDPTQIDQYVQKAEGKTPVQIKVPRFVDVNINLIRSVITRRLAAQSNKYSNLFPYYKYEPRGTSQVAKLRGELVSQLVELHTDWWDHRHHDIQVLRDTMLYAHSVDFPVSSYEKHERLVVDKNMPYEEGNAEMRGLKNIVEKEGVNFINPHPTRIFWDNSSPLSSINTDSGCEYIGYWDVKRFKDIGGNPAFWNRDQVTHSTGMINFFSTFSGYFSQYYTTITPPRIPDGVQMSGENDRKNRVGVYSGDADSTGVIVTTLFRKIVPSDYGIGDYDRPVWIRFVLAGDSTVVYAEIMPSRPAAYCGYNENDARQANISLAHELMSFQDQLTNLHNMLLILIRSGSSRIMLVNVDAMTDEQIKAVRRQATGQELQNGTLVVEYSKSKADEMQIDYANMVKLVETSPSGAISQIFQAISQLIQMAERLIALSPQEQGQPAPREISATETNAIAGTTESVYGFLSDSFDEYRAAKKRIIYEHIMSLGTPEFRLPVTSRFTAETIKLAGLEVDTSSDSVDTLGSDESGASKFLVIGSKDQLEYEYIFTTRDGAERSSNTQSANIINQMLLGLLGNPVTANALGKEKLYMMMNEIFRLGGSGIDLKLELQDGESNALGVDQNQQIQGLMQQLVAQIEQNTKDIQKLQQEVEGGTQPPADPTAVAQPLNN